MRIITRFQQISLLSTLSSCDLCLNKKVRFISKILRPFSYNMAHNFKGYLRYATVV